MIRLSVEMSTINTAEKLPNSTTLKFGLQKKER